MDIEQTVEDKFQKMRSQSAVHIIAEAKKVASPPLENGDRLTRHEFERRYNTMPQVKKAELIEGVVYMPSPVRHKNHGQPHAYIIGWLAAYCAATPGVDLSDNATVRLDIDNEVQPDALLRIEPEQGGHSRIGDDDYIEGAPELIVEIATTSAAYDLHDKLNVYRRNGVQEYLVWQTYENRLEWFHLREGEYFLLKPDKSGVVHSEVFPSLNLAQEALLKGDLATVLAELQKGLETTEHAEFVEQLSQKSSQTS
jgi:Uma2 family endonuclease